jgi:glycosyltransferase involved in cell wall biosynthesis
MHICQISKDVNIFVRDSEPFNRQLEYMTILKKKTNEHAKMTIIVLNKYPKERIELDNGLSIVRVSSSFLSRFLGLFFVLLRIQRNESIDALTSQSPIDEGWITLLFGKIFKIPVIAQIHFDIFNKYAIKQTLGEGIRGTIRFYLFKKTIKYFSKIRVVGKRITKQLLEQCDCTIDQIVLLPVMVPLLYNSKHTLPKNQDDTKFNVLYVGRLVAQKNLNFLLGIAAEVIKQDSKFFFDIVGDGPLREDLQLKCINMELQNNVIFHGEIPNSELPKFYQNSDLFILTSYYEGFGRVLIEAGAYNLPVLSTRITGPEDIIENGYNGYLLELEDKKGFVEKIFYLKNNPEERISLGLNNFNLVNERYNPNTLTEKWIELLIGN